ncbi:MAG: 3'(2'),5'-bisphosphate nucleotidase [Rickettsiales bacterium TMED289]|nr:MAG: 3'(2'),5'-bisphosphate nucleotidase [Rickettsiales bacterium TMED289]|tara:strand:+ start:239 stop:1030 length:792 start_codon:yes stop_codon:yes gene_type:complete
MDNLLFTAIRASIEAGKEIMKVYNNFSKSDVTIKNDNSPLTKADIVSNNKIKEILFKTNISILSEEEDQISYDVRKKWQKLWIIDPLDGTKEFIKKNDEFTVNIALVKNSKPILGVIFLPVSKLLYFSSKEIGSYKILIKRDLSTLNDLIYNSKKLPIKTLRNDFTIVVSRSHLSKETLEYIESVKLNQKNIKMLEKGSSLKICMVAEGKADVYPRFGPTMEWDTAAGQAICENAGFSLKDIETSNPIVYNRKNLRNNSFIVE